MRPGVLLTLRSVAIVEATPSVAVPLLQLGLLMAVVLVGNAVAVRRMPLETVPGILLGRVNLCNRLRPWLGAASVAMILSGLVLLLV